MDRLSCAALARVVLVTAACDDDWVVEVGTIYEEADGLPIEIPTSAVVGEPMPVTVVTSGGCMELERTDVEETDAGFLIVPLVRRYIGESPCSLKLCLFEHTATLTFDEPGKHSVVVRAKNFSDELVDYAFVVVVRE